MDINIIELLNTYAAYFIIGFTVIFIIFLIITISLMVKVSKLKKKYNKFMEGKSGSSLEDSILNKFEEINYLKDSDDKNRKEIKRISTDLLKTVNKVGIVKYDAFNVMGGKLSFSISMLNEYNDGFVMNSVHSTEGSYTYIKQIEKGESSIDLSEEEKKSIEKAIQS